VCNVGGDQAICVHETLICTFFYYTSIYEVSSTDETVTVLLYLGGGYKYYNERTRE